MKKSNMDKHSFAAQVSQDELLDLKGCVPDYYTECVIALWIWRTVPFVLVFIGTFGNIINIIILSRLRKDSAKSVFLLPLAISDLLFLWLVGIPNTTRAIASINVDDIGEVICRLRKWIGLTTGAFSVWILVLLNVERCLLIKAPVFSRTQLTHKTSLITVGVTLLLLAILNGHEVVGRTIQNISDSNTSETSKVCVHTPAEYKHFAETTWNMMIFVLYTLLPGCIILIGNISIAASLILRRKRLTKVHPSNKQKVVNDKKKRSSTVLLYILSTFFLVTTMPCFVYLVLKGKVANMVGRSFARWQLARAVVYVLLFSNFSFNFFFYFATGTLFKQEWQKLVNKTKQRFRNITKSQLNF